MALKANGNMNSLLTNSQVAAINNKCYDKSCGYHPLYLFQRSWLNLILWVMTIWEVVKSNGNAFVYVKSNDWELLRWAIKIS